MKKIKQKIEEILEGVFLHGKETPEHSHSLPEGQYTIAKGIDELFKTISQDIREIIRSDEEVVEKIFNQWKDIEVTPSNTMQLIYDTLKEIHKQQRKKAKQLGYKLDK